MRFDVKRLAVERIKLQVAIQGKSDAADNFHAGDKQCQNVVDAIRSSSTALDIQLDSWVTQDKVSHIKEKNELGGTNEINTWKQTYDERLAGSICQVTSDSILHINSQVQEAAVVMFWTPWAALALLIPGI